MNKEREEQLAAEATAIDEVQAAIDKIDFDGDTALPEEPGTPTPEPVVTEPEADGDPTPEPEPEPGEADPDPDPDSDDDAEEADKPALSDSHYRAAQRMGMTAEEISELYDSSPALAIKTIARCYDMVNAESKRLGELGRAAQKVQDKPEPAPQPTQPDSKVADLINKVQEHYGDDDPMAEVLTTLLKDRQAAPQPEPVAEPQVPARSVDEEIASRQQIGTFFGSPDLEAYVELYGENESVLGGWGHLTPGQKANRVEVCNRAQMLLYGAAAAGQEMGTAEALERAHLEIAAPMAEQVVRSRITKSAVRRMKGITLRPSGQRPSERSGGEHNHKEAVVEMGQALSSVFKK
ncbi:MAG: hypothetical protein JRE28_10380 [Deltaproteobacteria bacterium]|nr:hypothetical protein [Deltaproteobacteria bacterium]